MLGCLARIASRCIREGRRTDGEKRPGAGDIGAAPRRCADGDPEPELAARLIAAGAARRRGRASPPALSYRLELEGLGAWTRSPATRRGHGDAPRAATSNGDGLRDLDRRRRTLALLASGRSPVGRDGARRAAAAPRQAPQGARAAPALPGRRARASSRGWGSRSTPTCVFRSLAYAIDPEWTRGHSFTRRLRAGRRRAAAPGRSRSTTATVRVPARRRRRAPDAIGPDSLRTTGCGCSPASSRPPTRCSARADRGGGPRSAR